MSILECLGEIQIWFLVTGYAVRKTLGYTSMLPSACFSHWLNETYGITTFGKMMALAHFNGAVARWQD